MASIVSGHQGRAGRRVTHSGTRLRPTQVSGDTNRVLVAQSWSPASVPRRLQRTCRNGVRLVTCLGPVSLVWRAGGNGRRGRRMTPQSLTRLFPGPTGRGRLCHTGLFQFHGNGARLPLPEGQQLPETPVAATHSFIHSLTRSLTHSFTHSLTRLLPTHGALMGPTTGHTRQHGRLQPHGVWIQRGGHRRGGRGRGGTARDGAAGGSTSVGRPGRPGRGAL